MAKYHLALILASLTIAGCSGFKEFTYRHSQIERAEDAWKAAGPTGAGPDYKDGWQTGYFDLSMGSDGQVPPVPPEKYWKDKYQNPEGQQCIADWYAGYQDGVIAAEHVGEHEWQLVPSSGVAALPTATDVDYPTYYGSPTTGEHNLPEPLPAEPPVTSEHRQPAHAPLPSNDAVAATPPPAPDLRTLTGRPSASAIASLPAQQATPAAPTPRRVFERVPQPASDLPLVTNARENEQPSPTANVRDIAPVANTPVPNAIAKEQVVMEWPAPVVASSPETSTVQNSAMKPTPPVASAQPLASPPTKVESHEARPLFAHRSPDGASMRDESITHRNEVVTQPTPTAPSRRETSLGAPVVTPVPLFAFRHIDDRDDSVVRSMTVPPRAAASEPGANVTQTIPQPEYSSDSPSDGHWLFPRESKLEHDVVSPSTPKLAEIVSAPTARTLDKPAANSNVPADASATNVVNAPRRSDNNTTKPAAPTHRPIVVAAQPIQIPSQLAANPAPAQTVDAPKAKATGPAANTVGKDVSNRWKSIISEQIGDPNKASRPVASGQSSLTESVVKMAEPFPLKSSDTQAKPIVVVARPLRLSEASTTR